MSKDEGIDMDESEFDQFLVEQLRQVLEQPARSLGNPPLPPYGINEAERRMIVLRQKLTDLYKEEKDLSKEDLRAMGLSEEEIASIPIDKLRWRWEETQQGE